MKKKWLLISLLLLLVLAGVAFIAYNTTHKTALPPTSSQSQRQYKYVSNYSDGNYLYQCSQPVKAKLQSIPGPYNPNNPQDYKDYIPIDQNQAKLLCQSTAAVENEGKIKVLQRPEVKALIAKYQYRDITIKALEFKYIQDKTYVHRLLPDFNDKEIGCIIIFHSPAGDRVYLEDEKLNTFQELSYETFQSYLAKVSPADRQLFYDNLK